MRTIETSTETIAETASFFSENPFEDELPATLITLPARSLEEIADDDEFQFWAD